MAKRTSRETYELVDRRDRGLGISERGLPVPCYDLLYRVTTDLGHHYLIFERVTQPRGYGCLLFDEQMARLIWDDLGIESGPRDEVAR